jgi:DNA-binding HxlR family transcriptional regulator
MASGYGQFCPFAQAAEVFCERWTPLIIREVLQGSRRFTEITRGIPRLSRTLLAERLRTLEDRGLLERRGDGEYHPTQACLELAPIVMQLGAWGHKYIHKRVQKDHEDPAFVMWSLRRGVVLDRVPDGRTVIEFELIDARKRHRRWWLALERPEPDLCIVNPGYSVHVSVRAEVRTLASVWTGDTTFEQAKQDGSLALDGPPGLVAALPSWFRLNPFATR